LSHAQPSWSPDPRLKIALPYLFLVIAFCLTNIWIIAGSPLPWIGVVAGFLLAICWPAWMLYQKVDWRTESPTERFGYSVVSAVLSLMIIGLVINTLLPHLGVSRPLDRVPVLVSVDLWCALLTLWRRAPFRTALPRLRLDKLGHADWTVGLLSGLCVPMAVVGANRLNNGAGGGVTLVMLVVAGIALILMFVKRDKLNPGTSIAAIYLIALAMLLMTSLRGWSITGHDIQTEYKVFELAKSNGDWNIARFRDPYNACLSITILPTMLSQLIRVDDPYIYKFWFQLLFALCPVFVYRISLRHANNAVATVAAVYFIAFPAYFTDMPFLNRQEMAFLFVAACVMTATSPAVSAGPVRLRFAIFSLGVVLSHYSTSYVFFGTIAISWVIYKVVDVISRRRGAGETAGSVADRRAMAPTISLANVALVLLAIVLWNGVATDTAQGLKSTLSQAAYSLRGGSTDDKSSAVSYSLFFTKTPSQSQLLSAYWQSTLTQAAARQAKNIYYSVPVLENYQPKVVAQQNLPLTRLGRVIDDTGVSVSMINSVMRSGAAKILQIFVVVGLAIGFISLRRRRSRSFSELVSLSCGALLIVALQVVLPAISVDYGVSRAFQESLIVFGPFVAVGSFAVFRFLGQKWSLRVTFAVAALFFLSLTGVFPQTLGGYPAQLNLNNSGQYYDLYYVHPQSISAVEWLQSRLPGGFGVAARPKTETDRFTYNEIQNFASIPLSSSNFATQINKHAYIFLGYATVEKGQATLFYKGDLIAYGYPIGLLDSTKDLVYSSDGALIYG
jgi:uncharacterized membrane protein